MAYGLQNNLIDDQKNILVFDLGGGTFDVTVLNIEDKVFLVKATSGDSFLGGQDFDNKLMDYFFESMKEEIGEDPSKQKRALRRMRTQCEKIKILLSHSTEATLEF